MKSNLNIVLGILSKNLSENDREILIQSFSEHTFDHRPF